MGREAGGLSMDPGSLQRLLQAVGGGSPEDGQGLLAALARRRDVERQERGLQERGRASPGHGVRLGRRTGSRAENAPHRARAQRAERTENPLAATGGGTAPGTVDAAEERAREILLDTQMAKPRFGGGGAQALLFQPALVTAFPHTIATHAAASGESLDTLEQMLRANVYSALPVNLREHVAWQLALAVRQSATEHGEAADVLLSQLRARVVMLRRLSPRLLKSTKLLRVRHFTYATDLDRNGLFYSLGEPAKGKAYSAWTNPAGDKVSVRAHPSMDVGEAADMLSREDMTKGIVMSTRVSTNAFLEVDLGPKMRFSPTRYTLRAAWRSSANALRSWVLKASPDGDTWTTLDTHTRDSASLARSNSAHTWKLPERADATNSFRFFRVQLASPRAEPRSLCVSNFELYGSLPVYEDEDSASSLAVAAAAAAAAVEAAPSDGAPTASNGSGAGGSGSGAGNFSSSLGALLLGSLQPDMQTLERVRALIDTVPNAGARGGPEAGDGEQDTKDTVLDTLQAFLQKVVQGGTSSRVVVPAPAGAAAGVEAEEGAGAAFTVARDDVSVSAARELERLVLCRGRLPDIAAAAECLHASRVDEEEDRDGVLAKHVLGLVWAAMADEESLQGGKAFAELDQEERSSGVAARVPSLLLPSVQSLEFLGRVLSRAVGDFGAGAEERQPGPRGKAMVGWALLTRLNVAAWLREDTAPTERARTAAARLLRVSRRLLDEPRLARAFRPEKKRRELKHGSPEAHILMTSLARPVASTVSWPLQRALFNATGRV